MPERLVYDLDASTGALPPGWALTRASSAWRRAAAGRWDPVEAGMPIFEDLQVAAGASAPRQALRLEPRVTNLVPASVMGTGAWSGEAAMRHENRVRPAVATARAVLTEGLGQEDDPILTASDPGTSSQVITFWALLEVRDTERLAAGTYDTAAGWRELLHLKADGSVLANVGSSWWRRRIEQLGTGPEGSALYRLVLTGPRFGDDAALAPLGLYANHLRAVVHHAQLEETPGPTSPVPGGAVREEDRLVATPESMPLPWTLSIEAAAPPWSGREQVLWQADRDGDGDALRLVRDAYDGSLRLQQWAGGTLALDLELLPVLNEGASLGLALCVQDDRTVRWSIAGGAEQSATLPSWPGYVRERLGCAAMVGPSWGGWLARARRWHDVAADLTGLSTDNIGLAGTAPTILPAAVIPEQVT